MPYKDREKQLEAQKDHYRKNKSTYNAAWRKHQIKKRELLREAKEKACMDCDKEYPYYVMQFDHVEGIKKFNLGGATYKNYSVAKILDEISKCEVVCANCHAERTFSRMKELVS